MTIIVYNYRRNQLVADTQITDSHGRKTFASKFKRIKHGIVALCGPVFSAGIVASALERAEEVEGLREHLQGLTKVVEGFMLTASGVCYSVCLENEWLDVTKWTPGNAFCVGSGSEYYEAYEPLGMTMTGTALLVALVHPECGGQIEVSDGSSVVEYASTKGLEPLDLLHGETIGTQIPDPFTSVN